MAVNPMQRKARQSFLLGMVVMLVIAAIVVGLLIMQIMKYKDAEEAQAKASKQVYVLNGDIKSGQSISNSDFTPKKLVTEITQAELVTPQDITENTIAKIGLGRGTILTKSMITEKNETVTDSLRIQELNMLTLPSDLSKNDYIDIRLTLPNGQDFIVVSGKRVINSTDSTITLKMTEEEILTMTNAIVEAYIVEGSQLRVVKYTDPGIQGSAIPTYTVSKEVLNLIETDSNITVEARNALYTRYKADRRTEINTVVSANMDDYQGKVQEGLEEQNRKAQQERTKYIETLGGADLL